MSDGSGWVERVGATLTFAWRGSLGGVSTSGQVAATDSQRRLWAAGVLVTVLSVGEITGGGEPTEAHRWFTLGLVLVGAASVVFAAGVMIESMVDGRWSMVDGRAGVSQEKRMQRDIDKLTGHVIICGYGRVGRAVGSRADGPTA